jgi:hypothetical protein
VGVKKQIAYWYNAEPAPDETILDIDGDMMVPVKGDIIKRSGRQWKVEVVLIQHTIVGQRALPVHKVYLTDKLD